MPTPELQDQAAGLRRLLGGGRAFRACGVFGPDAGLRSAAIAAFASALARRGESVLILDEAEAPRNVAGQFGLAPRLRLAEVIQGRCDLGEALVRVGDGIQMLAVGQTLAALTGVDEAAWMSWADAVDALERPPGWLLVNAPGQTVPSLACGCSNRLLVVPDRKASLTEAYAVLKAVHRFYPADQWRVLTMNRTTRQGASDLHAALSATAQRFLGLRLEWFGAVPQDEQLARAARVMKPLYEVAPDCPAALAFRDLAEAAQDWPVEAGVERFWQRLYLLGRLAGEAPDSPSVPLRSKGHMAMPGARESPMRPIRYRYAE